MPVLGAILTPHPPVLLPEVGRGREREISATSRAMRDAAAEAASWGPDVLIVASPHTAMYSDYFHISPGGSARWRHVRLRRAAGSHGGEIRRAAAG